MENVQNGKVVGLSYSLKNDRGEELDRADAADPFFYLHGFGNIVVGLEKALEGLKIGDRKDVVVEADEGYGVVIEELRMQVDRASFPPNSVLAPGMQFQAQMNNALVPFTIASVDGDKINVDGNHPLAGERLHFAIEVLSMRDASDDEKEHGHAHGADGHAGH